MILLGFPRDLGAFNNLTCERWPGGRDALKLFDENITAWEVVRR